MSVKMKKTKKQVNNQNSMKNILSNGELSRRIKAIKRDLKVST